MALPLTGFTVVEVAKPNIGEKKPSRVRARVQSEGNAGQERPSDRGVRSGAEAKLPSQGRTYRVLLDCNQYWEDTGLTSQRAEDVYILMRKKPTDNNCKAVLETIRR